MPFPYKTLLVIILLLVTEKLFAQGTFRIIVTPNDSVYKWDNMEDEFGGGREFSIDEGTVIMFDNKEKKFRAVHATSGRGDFVGLEMYFHPNGLVESQGYNNYTTEIDSLKSMGRDGYLDYIGKDGWWYYWNDKGFLIRKENWRKGKLIQTVRFSIPVTKPNKGKLKR